MNSFFVYFACALCSRQWLIEPTFLKDRQRFDTIFRRRLLWCINFVIDECSPNLFLDVASLSNKIQRMVNLEQKRFLFFYYFVYLKVNLDLE